MLPIFSQIEGIYKEKQSMHIYFHINFGITINQAQNPFSSKNTEFDFFRLRRNEYIKSGGRYSAVPDEFENWPPNRD